MKSYSELITLTIFEGETMNDYLIHYGVKGMKWGVRKQLQARRKFTKARKLGNTSISSRTEDEWARRVRNKAEIGNYVPEIKKGQIAVDRARLLDAGYSKKEAQAGAEWMVKHGWSLGNDSAWKWKYR